MRELYERNRLCNGINVAKQQKIQRADDSYFAITYIMVTKSTITTIPLIPSLTIICRNYNLKFHYNFYR